MWYPVATDISSTQFLHLMFNHYGRGRQKDCKSQRDRKFAVKLCEAISMKSTQHCCQ